MIEVEGLTRHHGARRGVVDLTFSVPRGQVLGFLGPAGAGKSTALRVIAGYLSPSAGRASIAGHDVVRDSREARRHLGYLPEATTLHTDMRVEAYLRTMCQLRGVPPARRGAGIERALEACRLGDFRHDVIGHLSRGLRQRVGLAQAVVHDPEVLILDEPTAGLDTAQARESRELIGELAAQRTVLVSSRRLAEVGDLAARVLVLKDGALVADEAPSRLTRQVGASQRREVEATIKGDAAGVERHAHTLPGVDSVAVVALDGGELRLTVVGDGDDLQDAVAKMIINQGYSLRGLSTRELSLDEVISELGAEEPS